MGGSVELQSQLGQGARFNVRLPIARGVASLSLVASPLPAERRGSSLAGYTGDTLPPDDIETAGEELPRVLLVEDNPDMRRHVAELLRGRYTVTTAENGKRALSMMRAEPPHVVLSDVMMPELDGLSLVEIAKSDERLRHIPIILITARTGKDALVAALETGADDYIAKPFSPAELRARVRAAYRLGDAHRRLADLSEELRLTRKQLEQAEQRVELEGSSRAGARARG
jgi:CheY-like chemotaxis protein